MYWGACGQLLEFAGDGTHCGLTQPPKLAYAAPANEPCTCRPHKCLLLPVTCLRLLGPIGLRLSLHRANAPSGRCTRPGMTPRLAQGLPPLLRLPASPAHASTRCSQCPLTLPRRLKMFSRQVNRPASHVTTSYSCRPKLPGPAFNCRKHLLHLHPTLQSMGLTSCPPSVRLLLSHLRTNKQLVLPRKALHRYR